MRLERTRAIGGRDVWNARARLTTDNWSGNGDNGQNVGFLQCTLEPVPKWYIYEARIRAAIDEETRNILGAEGTMRFLLAHAGDS